MASRKENVNSSAAIDERLPACDVVDACGDLNHGEHAAAMLLTAWRCRALRGVAWCGLVWLGIAAVE
ncbi:hypothetical protein BN2475_130055 [Paraburkholderia ribeironis]|uniref:Uncharacterized protein n=1 Tax=Paraburkholderia ribeironis TaxID=1247936 RepID=A0A1N7RSD9_9BURK|nr:hypothetical protein BN2475_130055 [Paraburkholderia ribeironis]